jgi:hypothetical protein
VGVVVLVVVVGGLYYGSTSRKCAVCTRASTQANAQSRTALANRIDICTRANSLLFEIVCERGELSLADEKRKKR